MDFIKLYVNWPFFVSFCFLSDVKLYFVFTRVTHLNWVTVVPRLG